MLRFRRNQFAVDYWPASADRQQVRFDPPRLQHLRQVSGIFLDVRHVTRNVGDRKEFTQLSYDALLIVHPIFANFLRDLRRRRSSLLLRERLGGKNRNQQSDHDVSQSSLL